MAKRHFFRDFIGVLNSNIFSIICGVLVVILLTRILGPEGFGLYYTLLVIPLLVVGMTHMGIRGASIYMIGQKKYNENDIVSSVITILIFTSLLGVISSVVAYYYFFNPNFTILIISLVVLIIPFRLSIIYIGGIFFGKDEIKKANRFEWAINLTNLVLAALLVWGLKLNLLGAVISVSLANVAVGIWALTIIFKQFNVKISFSSVIIKQLLTLGVMYSFTFFIVQLNYRIDILLLEKLSTINEVGIYSLGIHIAEQLWQIPMAISIVLFSRTANISDHKLMTKSTLSLVRISTALVLFLSVLLIFTAPTIIPLIFGNDFIRSAEILNYILPGIVFLVIFRVLSGQLAGMGKPYLAAYAFAPALLVNIILNLLWIPEYGGKGAALASDISYSIGTIIYIFIYSKQLKVGFLDIFKITKSDITTFANFKTKLLQKWQS